VYGFLDGYRGGFLDACLLADELFKTDKPHRLGDGHRPTDMPSTRCMARTIEFSEVKLPAPQGVNVDAYTTVITDFYEKHASCRDFPFAILLKVLGSKYATADRLYEAAMKGQLTPRSRQWCSAGGLQPARP
jgi:hypothetical protein